MRTVVFALALLGGCGDPVGLPPAEAGRSCATESDCPAWLMCAGWKPHESQSICTAGCSIDRDCGSGGVCEVSGTETLPDGEVQTFKLCWWG